MLIHMHELTDKSQHYTSMLTDLRLDEFNNTRLKDINLGDSLCVVNQPDQAQSSDCHQPHREIYVSR
jgi:hypothetical protein